MAVGIPIPKSGKNYLQATNYRPISLTSCIFTVLEKMVNVRLMWYLESGDFFIPVQYGFRKVMLFYIWNRQFARHLQIITTT